MDREEGIQAAFGKLANAVSCACQLQVQYSILNPKSQATDLDLLHVCSRLTPPFLNLKPQTLNFRRAVSRSSTLNYKPYVPSPGSESMLVPKP